jgi:peptidoglycan lytic transglycosylase A
MPGIWRNLLAVSGVALVLAACGGPDHGPGPVRAWQTNDAAGGYRQLVGWSQDHVAAAVPAFLRSCARLSRRPDSAPLDPAARGAGFGRVGDWRELCHEAAALPRGDDSAARRFFEANFVPVLASRSGDSEGLITGYYEMVLKGSRTRRGRYQTPVYRRPPELASLPSSLDRASIEDGALAARNLELVWLASPANLFLLQTQGSGRVQLTDGSSMHLGYAGNNGRRPVAVDRLLLRSGAIPAAQFSQSAVHAWMLSHPGQAQAVRRADPAYVFFRELKGDGPVGAEGALLTPGRSLAVDHRYVPLGMPLWLQAKDRYRSTTLHRLVIAQDTGDGIEGPVRGDFYWGSGPQAQARGADFYATGGYHLMLPRNVAARVATR